MQVSRLLLLWSVLQLVVVVADCFGGILFLKVKVGRWGLQLPIEEAVCLILVR